MDSSHLVLQNPTCCFSFFRTVRLVTSSIEATSEWLYDHQLHQRGALIEERLLLPFFSLITIRAIHVPINQRRCNRFVLRPYDSRWHSSVFDRKHQREQQRPHFAMVISRKESLETSDSNVLGIIHVRSEIDKRMTSQSNGDWRAKLHFHWNKFTILI